MKFSLAWYTSLCAALHPAWGADDSGSVTHLDPAGGPVPPVGRHAALRLKPRLEPTSQKDKTVVIVGGGYAGWGAAARLVEGGMRHRDITILEAAAGFGGRTRTDEEFMPFPLELGASFVHDRFRRELAELAGVPIADLPLVLTEVDDWYAWQDPWTYYDFLADHLVGRLDACESEEECRKRAEGMGYTFKNTHSDEGGYGCYSKNNEAFWSGGTDEENYTSLLTGNRKRILCDRINKEYGCQVTAVDYSDSSVETTCDTGTASKSFASTQVIVTVPLSVLKDDDIAFEPALPAGIQENVDERAWFRGFKLFVEFDTSFQPYPSLAFGGAYDRDENGVRTGEHLTWDHTKYSAPAFEGKRNLVINSFVGTKADEFTGMNEAQIVARVLEKFEDYYNGEDYDYYYEKTKNDKARGYNASSYKRHLLVKWDDEPFVQGTYSGPNKAFRGHRTDASNRLFVAGEAFPAPLLEFCTSPAHCYYDYYFAELPEEIQDAYAALGWDEDSWNAGAADPDAYAKHWDDLDDEQKEGAATVGYTQESWDRRLMCETTPDECYYSEYWQNLPLKIQEAYGVLGWNKKKWNKEIPPDPYTTLWAQLTAEQQQAATFIGYTQVMWDGRLGVAATAVADGCDCPALPYAYVDGRCTRGCGKTGLLGQTSYDTMGDCCVAQFETSTCRRNDECVKYESEAWVYTALHSGQKAAEMILALPTDAPTNAPIPALTFPPTTPPSVLPSVLPSVSPSAPPSDPSSVLPTLKPSPGPTCKSKTTKSCSEDAECACFTRCEKKPSKCKCLQNKCRVRRWDCATKGWEHNWWKCGKSTSKECVPWYTKTWSTGTYVSKWGVCKTIQE